MSEKLLESCMEGDLNQVKELLTNKDNPIDIHYRNSDGWNALLSACYEGSLEIVQYLLASEDLKEHANICDKDNDGLNVLMVACDLGSLHIVEYLLTSNQLKKQLNIHDTDEYGQNALLYAALNSHLEIAQYLIINQNMQINENSMSWLLENGKQDILKMIQARDIYHKMNNNLSNSNKKVKQRKV